MGGLVQMVPVQATVTMSEAPDASAQLTITAGSGYSMFPPRQTCFAISSLPSFQRFPQK